QTLLRRSCAEWPAEKCRCFGFARHPRGSVDACRSPGERCNTVRSRREVTGSPARDTLLRSPAHVPTASLEAPASRAHFPNGAAGNGTAPHNGSSPASPHPVPVAGRKSLQNGLKNWRGRARPLLLVVVPTVFAGLLCGAPPPAPPPPPPPPPPHHPTTS